MESFTSKLMHNIGDLIHYQEHDYQEKTPIDSSVYGFIGELIRVMSREPGIEESTVREALEVIDISGTLMDHKQSLLLLEDFNAPMLIDLVTRMQGKDKDDTFFECIEMTKTVNLKV